MEVFKHQWKEIRFEQDRCTYYDRFVHKTIGKPIAFRYFTDIIDFHYFRWGLKFVIELKDERSKKIKFTFRSYFAASRERLLKKAEDLLEYVWTHLLEPVSDAYLAELNEGKSIEISDFRISQISISKLDRKGKVLKEIEFEQAKLIRTYEKLVVCSTVDRNLHIDIADQRHWNAFIIQEIVKLACHSST